MDYEQIVFNIIIYAGNARAKAYEALSEAKKGDFIKAETLINEAGDEIIKAHDIQNDLIAREAGGDGINTTLLLVHAEDHLMNAITSRDIIKEVIDLYKRIRENI
ncbi:MAG TPA: PTS lactose/cellobiose transporter subunit IIA [Thermoanaerobacterales bacterium]|nr:PTS lactose/cellobiose transporter subunit IIA [Thermoanaerobacterales bacterium]